MTVHLPWRLLQMRGHFAGALLRAPETGACVDRRETLCKPGNGEATARAIAATGEMYLPHLQDRQLDEEIDRDLEDG
jgi:hypothetical protein